MIVIDIDELLPEFLLLWFKRPEFDRYARYHSIGSVREVFDWSDMCAVQAYLESPCRRLPFSANTLPSLSRREPSKPPIKTLLH